MIGDPADRRMLVGLSVVAFGMAALMALGPLQGIAHVSDEVAYTLQARLFAAGMRTGPAGDQPSMLLYPFWQVAPRSFAVFPPGWPALLALGQAIGAPWIVNALLAAALPPLSFALALAWKRPLVEARLAALVITLSPGIVLLSGSRMPHTSVLVALLLALVVVESRPRAWWGWLLASLGLGYVVLARQFDAALLAGPLLLLGAWRLRDRLGLLTGWLLPPTVAAALILVDNHHLTGDAFTFPVGPWFDQWVADSGRPPGCNSLGFGPTHGCHLTFGSFGHTPAKAARIAGQTTLLLDRYLLGLPGGLLIALIGAVRIRRLAIPLAITLLTVGGYALYWSPGNVYGARFYHPLYMVLPVLVAGGLAALPGLLRRWLPALVLGLGCLWGLGHAVMDLREGYWCVDGQLAELLSRQGIDHGVLMVMGGGQRAASWPALGQDEFVCDPLLDSGAAFQLMDPTRQSGELQVRHAPTDPDQLRAYLSHYHPGDPAWLVVHDVTRDHWRIQAVTGQ
ncbi:MAG: hypothetical protein GXP62_17405 [Oligoflexia bacterium]|nr:hypothetical protein [Oligoflexia bacterium]